MPKKSNSHPHSAKQGLKDSQPDAAEQTFPVVGVGASAGGLDAFTKLLRKRRAQKMFDYTEAEALQSNAGALTPETAQEDTRGLFERLKRGDHGRPAKHGAVPGAAARSRLG